MPSLPAPAVADAPAPPLPPLLISRLREELPDSDVLPSEPMARHTSFRIGGPADVLVMPRTAADLQRALRLSRGLELPLTVVGNGSNLLVRDGGLRGIVLKVAENLGRVRFEGNRCAADAGALLAGVSRRAAQHGAALVRQGVAGAHRGANVQQRTERPLHAGPMPFGQGSDLLAQRGQARGGRGVLVGSRAELRRGRAGLVELLRLALGAAGHA